MYQLVQFVDGQFITSTFTADQVIPSFSVRGFEFLRLEGRKTLRPELQGQPQFSGLYGPCWGGTTDDGKPIIRYETKSVYAELSAD